MRARWLIPVCLLLLSVLSAASPPERAVRLIVADGWRSVYPVDIGFALVGTDSVELDGYLLGPDEYRLDLERGLLLFPRTPGRWSVIRITCAVLPLDLPDTWRRYRVLAREPGVEPDSEPVMPRAEYRPETAELDITGNKTIGIVIGGPEGTGLNQATRLAVRGQVEGVQIDAELSDQSSPIPPEGTTLELDELDIIRVELAGRNWRGSFGDLDLRIPSVGFGTLERRSVGGLISAQTGPAGGRLGYFRPRGRYARAGFTGIDGVQGPYILAPDGRQARLVTGSEQIWLNGRLLTRGWDADYTIDYSTGELMFTNRNLMDRFTRIEAVYQYMLEAWERTDLVGGVTFEPGGLQISADYFRETDDPDRPGYYELEPEEREYLAGIGTDTSRAWLDGGTRVGDGTGSYMRENGVYRYVGENQGNYRVLFSFVGDSLGDYVFDDSLLAHRYVGLQAGDYVAGYRVELPERAELVRLEFSLGGRPAVGEHGSHITLTAIGRRNLVNLLAPRPEPGLDGAIGLQAGWQGEKLGLQYRGRALAPGFSFPGGDSLVDAGYRWGGIPSERFRHLNELSAGYGPREWLGLRAELGLAETADNSLLARYVGRVNAGPVAVEAGQYGVETGLDVKAEPVFGRFRPRAGFNRRRSSPAGRYLLEAGLGIIPGAGLDIDIGYAYLRADSSDTARNPRTTETGGTATAGASWRAGERLRAEVRVAHQERAVPGSGSGQSLLVDAGLTATPRPGLRLQGDFRQSRRLVQLRDEYYRYVGPGEGSYSRDSLTGRYYYDPAGEYERILSARGSYIPADERALNLIADWTAWRPVGLSATLGRTDVTDSVPVRRSHNHNIRAAFRSLEPVLSIWLTANGSSTSDRTLAATGRETERHRYAAEAYTGRLPGVELRLRGEYGQDERWGTGGRTEHTERLRLVKFEPIIGSRVRLELELGGEWSRIAQPLFYPELGEFSLTGLSAGAGRGLSLGPRWRIRGRAGVVRRTASIPELPFEITLSRPLGWTPSAVAELSHILNESITLNSRYDFLGRPDRPAEHRVSAELRALF